MNGEKHIITNCDELILAKFIRCIEKQDYSVLCNQEALPEELENAWSLIYDEFCCLTKQKKYIKALELSKDIALLQSKITAIDLCINVMSRKDSDECKEILKKYGYNYKFDIFDTENYIKELKKVIAISKIAVITLERKNKEFEELRKEAEKTQKESINFSETLAAISKWQGYRIDPLVVTVSEYAGILNNIEKANKANGRR